MTDTAVIEILMEAVKIAAKLSAPILVTALAVGFAISLMQSVTQVQEITLSFVPKAIAVALAILIAGNWMMAEVISFTTQLYERIPDLVRGG